MRQSHWHALALTGVQSERLPMMQLPRGARGKDGTAGDERMYSALARGSTCEGVLLRCSVHSCRAPGERHLLRGSARIQGPQLQTAWHTPTTHSSVSLHSTVGLLNVTRWCGKYGAGALGFAGRLQRWSRQTSLPRSTAPPWPASVYGPERIVLNRYRRPS